MRRFLQEDAKAKGEKSSRPGARVIDDVYEHDPGGVCVCCDQCID
jgi:hypothetical protein